VGLLPSAPCAWGRGVSAAACQQSARTFCPSLVSALSHVHGSVTVHVFGRTDIGRSREHNEDAFLVADLSTGTQGLEGGVREHVVGSRGMLFMVADGLGGAVSGELASGMAVDVVVEQLRRRLGETAQPEASDFAAGLKAAAEAANGAIHAFALRHPEHRGMGTTATIAGILGDTLYLVQVGDSRAYLVRDGVARQITKDQSLIQRLIEAGEITPEEAEQSERRNIILQALGPEANIKIDLTHQLVRRGDVLVLCTDGLSGVVRRGEIAGIVTEEPDLEAACARLIDRANENGGPDNVTVIAARFEGDGLQSASTDDTVGHTVFALASSTPPEAAPVRRGGERLSGAGASRAQAAPRRLAWLLRGNMPYVLAVIAAAFVALLALAARLRSDRHTRPAPAPRQSVPAAVPPAGGR
jgi:protein phosphatase